MRQLLSFVKAVLSPLNQGKVDADEMKEILNKQLRKATAAKGGKKLTQSVKKLQKAVKEGGYGASLLKATGKKKETKCAVCKGALDDDMVDLECCKSVCAECILQNSVPDEGRHELMLGALLNEQEVFLQHPLNTKTGKSEQPKSFLLTTSEQHRFVAAQQPNSKNRRKRVKKAQ